MALSGADMMRQALAAGRYDNVQNQAFSTHQINKAAVESGQMNGFKLQVVNNPLAELTNSMEELSFQFEEKTMKKIGDRKFGDKHGPNAAYLTAVQTWQKVMPDMPGGQFMERMLRQLRQMEAQKRFLTGDDVLGMLKEGSKEVSHQFAMLDILAKTFGEDGAAAKAVDEAKRKLMAEKGAEVRAGINLAEVVNARAKNAEEMQELRDLYRGVVLGYTTPQECFRSLLAKEGAGRLSEAIRFLIESCSIDLQSASPSRSPEELRRIVLDLQCVSVVATMKDKVELLDQRMKREFGEKMKLGTEPFMERLMNLTERSFADVTDYETLIADCGIKSPLAKLQFCMGLMDTVRSLSPRLFVDEEDRIRLVDAGQRLLDDLVLAQEKVDEAEGRRGVA